MAHIGTPKLKPDTGQIPYTGFAVAPDILHFAGPRSEYDVLVAKHGKPLIIRQLSKIHARASWKVA